MNLRKLVASALLLSVLTLVGTQSANGATPKPGASCPAKGAYQITKSGTKDLKIVCTAQGKKRVWSKWQTLPPLTLDNLDPQRVREAAFAELSRELNSTDNPVSAFTYINGPHVSADDVNAEKSGLARATKFWSDIFQPKKLFVSYIVAEDADWIDDALCAGANNCTSTSPTAHSWGQNIKAVPQACTFGEATATNDKVPLLVQCLGPGNKDIQNRQTGAHEYTHLAQQAFTGPFSNNPRWFTEGSAIYFGGTLGLYESAKIPAKLNYVLRYDAATWRKQPLCDVSTVDVDSVVGCLNFSYLTGPPVDPQLRGLISSTSYYPGSLVTEAMVAVFGVDKIKEFMKQLASSNFDETFTKSFGISVKEFYPKVAKYVVAMYNAGY